MAPPGHSLHRCATELDLGPDAAYGWLAANASRFGFVQRYCWEAWHYGFDAGPAPCSEAGNSVSGAGGGGAAAAASPARLRPCPLPRAAARRRRPLERLRRPAGGPADGESNFNPFAVSPAGAQGIAQFMPGTAASYGLADPFDPVAAIDAQAHLMSDLIRQLGSPDSPSPATTPAPAPSKPATASRPTPRPRPTSPGSSPCSAAPGRSPLRPSKSAWWRDVPLVCSSKGEGCAQVASQARSSASRRRLNALGFSA